MKPNHMAGVLFALALGVTVSAQTPAPGAQQPQSSPANAGGTTPITLTGCLGTPAPAVAGAPPRPAGGSYMLNDAVAAEAKAPKSYALLGGDSKALRRYRNSRVEIIGSMDPQPAAAFSGGSQIGRSPVGAGVTGAVGTSASGATPTTSAVTPTPTPPAPPAFHITSIRQVSGSCGGR
jgi:hypothetical protein